MSSGENTEEYAGEAACEIQMYGNDGVEVPYDVEQILSAEDAAGTKADIGQSLVNLFLAKRGRLVAIPDSFEGEAALSVNARIPRQYLGKIDEYITMGIVPFYTRSSDYKKLAYDLLVIFMDKLAETENRHTKMGMTNSNALTALLKMADLETQHAKSAVAAEKLRMRVADMEEHGGTASEIRELVLSYALQVDSMEPGYIKGILVKDLVTDYAQYLPPEIKANEMWFPSMDPDTFSGEDPKDEKYYIPGVTR